MAEIYSERRVQRIEYKRFTLDPTAVIDSEKTKDQMND